MIYTPDYTLSVDGKDVHFLFRSQTFKKYSLRKGMELAAFRLTLYKTLTSQEDQTVDTAGVKAIQVDDYADLLLAGNEAYCIYNKIPFTADEAEAYLWIDEMGGIVLCDIEMYKVLALCFAHICRVPVSSLLVSRETDDDKKKEVMNPSHGISSTISDAPQG